MQSLFRSAKGAFGRSPAKSNYVLVKRSSGRKFNVRSQPFTQADSLAQLPLANILSPAEIIDTFDIFTKEKGALERLSFAGLEASRFSDKEFSAFLYATEHGNASVVLARRQLRKLNVAILMHQLNFTGGKTVAMIALAEMLKAAGFKVKIIALWLTAGPVKFKLPDDIEFDYVDSYMEMRAGEEPLKISPPDITMSERTRKKIETFFSKEASDLIYFPDYDSELHSIIFKALPKNVARVIGDHNPGRANSTMEWSKVPSKAARNKRFIQAAKLADAVHVVNPPLAKYYEKSLGKPVLSISNTVSVGTSQRASPFRSRKIIVIGRFADEKRIPEAIEAFAIASATGEEWTMDIYGEGRERASVEEALQNSEVGDRISLIEPTPDVLERMVECAIHFSASAFESFGLTIAEAMLIGCPVVARDHPGSRFLLSGGRGVIAADPSVAALATALRQAMDDVESQSASLTAQIDLARDFVDALTPQLIGRQWHRAVIEVVNRKFN